MPWIAATVSLLQPSMTAPASTAPAAGLPALSKPVMSAPAMKVRPAQIRTTALASEASAARKPAMIPSRTGCDRAFTGGEFRVMTAISPSKERSVTELI